MKTKQAQQPDDTTLKTTKGAPPNLPPTPTIPRCSPSNCAGGTNGSTNQPTNQPANQRTSIPTLVDNRLQHGQTATKRPRLLLQKTHRTPPPTPPTPPLLPPIAPLLRVTPLPTNLTLPPPCNPLLHPLTPLVSLPLPLVAVTLFSLISLTCTHTHTYIQTHIRSTHIQ